MNFILRKIKKRTQEGEIIGDEIGEIELERMPKLRNSLTYKKKKYIIDSIDILDQDHGGVKRLNLQ